MKLETNAEYDKWQEIVRLATRLQNIDRTGSPDITNLLDDGEWLAQLIVTFDETK